MVRLSFPFFCLRATTDGLQPSCDPSVVDLSVPGNNYHLRRYSIAVTGDVFRWMVDFGSEQVLNKVRNVE